MDHQGFVIKPIGQVQSSGNEVTLAINEDYRQGLKQLKLFSHIIVLWWANRHDNKDSRNILTTRPPYAKEHLTGVFACRAEYRPNPIAISTCRILEFNEAEGIIKIAKIDAFDQTPIIDIKAYFPVCDRVKEPKIPDWLSDWPEWSPEEGLGL